MDFPAYVPAGARAHISRTLEGGGNHWQGVNALVTEYRETYASTDALVSLEQEQACVLRFAHDPRMREVYAELQKVFTSDDQYANFLRSAWKADMNYAPFRERTRQAGKLARKIASAARELADLLGQAGMAGGGFAPPEFYSIHTLLSVTDNHDDDDHNLHMWRTVRGAILGKRCEPSPALQGSQPNESTRFVLVPIKPGEAKLDPEVEARNVLFYAWEKAPDLPAILATVAEAASNWTPQEQGAIGAAIVSRKQNKAAEYLRAFAEHLRESLHIELTGPIVAAMAGMANVVLNDPDTDVSTDAARAFIKKG